MSFLFRRSKNSRTRSLCELRIYNCERLEFPITLQHPFKTTSIQIRNSCGSLVFFPLDLFPNLSSLSLSECENLESVGVSSDGYGLQKSHSLTSLSHIKIKRCPNFISFLKGGLHAPDLAALKVSGCKKLKKLPEQMHNLFPSLQELKISYCPEVESFTEGGLPSNLSDLSVLDCPRLFPQLMKWNLPSTLSYLRIGGCPDLKKLDMKGLQNLTSLKTLRMESCPQLEKLPQQGLPTSVESLDIVGCPELEELPQQGLPSTLSYLRIGGCPDLKRLDIKGLQNLTSLKTLCIVKCPQLQELPQQGLPTSVEHLEISDCPLLKERCQRETGEDWNIISHIPLIQIDYRRIG